MITVKITYDKMTPNLKSKQKKLALVPGKAHKEWVKVTPKRTGNAKRKTKLKGGDTIDANYPYAVPLDKGKSRQAPQGMLKPTMQFIKKEVDKIFRKI